MIFLSHANQDKSSVRELCEKLKADSFDPWLDEERLFPGMNWEIEIEKALRASDTILLCFSTLSVEKEGYIQREYKRAMHYQEEKPEGAIYVIPVRLDECEPPSFIREIQFVDYPKGYDRLVVSLNLRSGKLASAPPISPKKKLKKSSHFLREDSSGGDNKESSDHNWNEMDIDTGRLPIPNISRNFGRERELEKLSGYLIDSIVSVVSIIGFAGVGKSTLVDFFLTRIAPKYEGATKILGWHFYSQETKDSAITSSSLFFEHALRFYGYHEALPVQDIEKASILAKLVRSQNSIIIIDGVESLQNLPTINRGEFHDAAIQAFIADIARNGLPMGGLMIITSRQQLVEMNRFEMTKTIELQNLSIEDGVKLLQFLRVSGTRQELVDTVKDYQGHALSLVLLGNLLVNDYDGDVLNRAKVDVLDQELYKSSKAVLGYYSRDWEEYESERVFLYLLSLLNRPMQKEELAKLKEKSRIARNLPDLRTVQFNRIISKLSSLGLVIRLNQSYDTHALIRSFFLQEFREKHLTEYEDAHRVLFEYFVNIPEKECPDTLDEIEPLYRAIYHGCQSKQYAQAMEIYWKRISRQMVFYSQRKLGAISTDLYAIMNFFPDGWYPPAESNLPLDKQAWLLAVASFLLMSLGRLEDALAPRYAEIKVFESLQDWALVAGDSRNLAQILLALGKLNEALQVAYRSVEYAKRATGDTNKTQFSKNADLTLTLAKCKSHLAEILHLMGNIGEAQKEFEEAEQLQGRELERASGFCYLRLLLQITEPERLDELASRTQRGLDKSNAEGDIKNIANYTLIKALIHQHMKQYDDAHREFDTAIQKFTLSQRTDNLSYALLRRADFFKQRWLETSDNSWLDLCQKDLDEVENLVRNLRMVLYDIDRRIIQIDILNRAGRSQQVQTLYTETKRMITVTNYQLKLQELEDAYQDHQA